MAVKASSELIRQMKKDIDHIIRDMNIISQGIRAGVKATSTWNDEKAKEFQAIMYRVSDLTKEPVETLSRALPKLEKLAQILDAYNQVKF